MTAQDDGAGIEISTNTTSEETESYAQEVDPQTRLVSWNYNDNREGFELRFETDRSKRITLTEAVQFSEGAGSGRIYQERLPEGTSDVFVKVPRRGGQAAVTMTTAASIEQNRFSYVSTGETTPDRPAISYERVQMLIFVTAVGTVGATIRVIRGRREDEEETWRRLL
ncbi:hypothetical protein [Halorubrum halophilum]|uniref:hypothetical protein n=1 Tax=Halorubrum halophilum TaxID=413816 RepID=UPI001D0304FD|nr:hypothetical protein [Halorubrum halophilum]